LFTTLRLLPWTRDRVKIFGREHLAPRLSAWYGDPGVEYRYSGATHVAQPWTAELRSLRDRLDAVIGVRFNFVLANFYRDGGDSMGWHSDAEAALGPAPVIASLSFGATRRLAFRERKGRGRRAEIALEHGSLLVMAGDSQQRWQHALPRSRRVSGERINLTFRRLLV
jgi:alkylated DNA repair dioxygenase AlkB